MFNKDRVVKPVLFGNLDAIFDEKGSTFLSMRKVQWVPEGETPDESKAKLELRKWRVTDEGERADKGFSFLTEEGPHELAKSLIHEGYGRTNEILKELIHRDDFKESVNHLSDEENVSSDGEFFDMRNILLSANEEEKDEEDE